MNILRDPIWDTIIGLLFTLAVAAVVYLLQQSRKAISYEIVSGSTVVEVGEEVNNKIKVIYNNKEIDDVSLVVIRVRNSGNVPILESDFRGPITFTFGYAEILEVSIKMVNRRGIKPLLKQQGNKVRFEPILLNPRDLFEFKVLLTNWSFEQIKADGRIVGIQQLATSVGIKENTSRRITTPFWIPLALGMMFTLSGYTIFEDLSINEKYNKEYFSQILFAKGNTTNFYDLWSSYSSYIYFNVFTLIIFLLIIIVFSVFIYRNSSK